LRENDHAKKKDAWLRVRGVQQSLTESQAMEGSIRSRDAEGKVLLKADWAGSDARLARRAHAVLLRSANLSWERIRSY
jgi:hypothetical protein